MDEEQQGIELRVNNPVAMYFWRAKDLALREPDFIGKSHMLRHEYVQEIRITYDVLYDRIMATDMSPFLKQEVEQWYDFNKHFFGFMRTKDLNDELEVMLTRFNLI